jgi:hypothetical protein
VLFDNYVSVNRQKKYASSVAHDKILSRNDIYKVIKEDRFTETFPGKDSVKYCGLPKRNSRKQALRYRNRYTTLLILLDI